MRPNISVPLGRKGQLLTKLMLATGSLCISLIIAELILRSIIPMDSSQPFEFRIPHPVLGWVLEPGASYVYKTPETTITVSYNSQGWRDIEHAVKKPDGIFRILVLGDSYMEANSVELNDTFARRVEGFARAAGINTEVINMGVAGYGTLQEYLVFRDIGRLYKPDLVLLAFFDGNDLTNDSLELAPILSEGGVVTTRPFLDPNEPTRWTITQVDFNRAQRIYSEYMTNLEANRNKLTEKLVTLHLFLAGITKIPVPKFPQGWKNNIQPIDRERQELALLGVNYCPEPAEFTGAWETQKRILIRLKEDVEASGGKLVVFTVPAIEEVSVDYMKMVADHAVNPAKLCLEDAPGHTRLRDMLKSLNIEEIPLLQDFRKVMREDSIQLYRLSDQHWNPEGHALAAERVVSELIKRQLLPITGEKTSSPY